MKAIEIGTASVNWGFDPLYNWITPPSFGKMLDEMAAAGYAGTEISYNFPSDAAQLREELEPRKLQAAASFHAVDVRERSSHQAALASVTPVADRLQALGSRVLILSDKPSPARIAVAGRVASDGSDGLTEGQWHAVADGLQRIAESLSARGMHAVFHPHVGSYVETRAEIDKLCSLTDASLLALCPDTGHLAYAGVAPEEVFRDYAPRIGYVHLKDVDPEKLVRVRAERIGFVDAVKLGLFVELGSGMVPFASIIAALQQAAFRGWLIVEQDAPQHPLASARRNRQFLREEFGL